MRTLKAKTTAVVFGTRDSWSLSPQPQYKAVGIECTIHLEISGDEKDGCHLNLSPDGFFTADDWHLTIEDAKNSAYELFGVTLQQWREEETARGDS